MPNCQTAEMNLKKDWALESFLFMFEFSLSYETNHIMCSQLAGIESWEKETGSSAVMQKH